MNINYNLVTPDSSAPASPESVTSNFLNGYNIDHTPIAMIQNDEDIEVQTPLFGFNFIKQNLTPENLPSSGFITPTTPIIPMNLDAGYPNPFQTPPRLPSYEQAPWAPLANRERPHTATNLEALRNRIERNRAVLRNKSSYEMFEPSYRDIFNCYNKRDRDDEGNSHGRGIGI